MKKLASLVSLGSLAALTACGGGGDVGDGQTEFTVSPPSVNLTSAGTTCPLNDGFMVFALGGTAPYTIRNPLPNQIALSTDTITKAGEGVTVRLKGGCFSSIPLSFTDGTGKTVSTSVSYLAQAS